MMKRRKVRGKPRTGGTGSQIEVHITFENPVPGCPGGEYLSARQINKNTAKIECSPFGTGKVARGDLVRFDEDHEVTKVLEHVARTRAMIYADGANLPLEKVAERYAQVCEELSKHDIYTEGMFPGICSICVPNDIDDDQLEIIAEKLDVELVFHEE